MTLGELLNDAIQIEAHGLQSLIMLVVFEKQVLTLEDDERELDLYFKPNNKKRLNKILIDYEEKLGIKHSPLFYEVDTNRKKYIVKAKNKHDAISLFKNNKVDSIKYMDSHTQMVSVDENHNVSGRYKLDDYAENFPIPSIITKW